jgi:hypothetical protein
MYNAPIAIEDFSIRVIKCFLFIEPYQMRRKEIVEENSYWNDVDSAVNRHVNNGI